MLLCGSTSRTVSVLLRQNKTTKLFSVQTSTKATVPLRKIVTKEERAALRAARKEQAAVQLFQATNVSSKSTASGNPTLNAASGKRPTDPRIVYGLGLGLPVIALVWGIYDENSPAARFAQLIGLSDMIDHKFHKPCRTQLLPDWGMMPNIPPDMTPPHTLVLDLENTLVNSEWDRKNGWRHAKRPGVDKFLGEMAQYYEIVLYSPSHDGVAQPVVQNLDKSGCIMHQLYRDACYYKNGVHMKDLSSLNRDVNKVILLDDDVKAAALNPENLIKVKPYDNPRDRNDNTLARITPFLIEIAREGYNDIPKLLKQFQGMDSDGIADELERRVTTIQDTRTQSTGLGSYVRRRPNLPDPEMTPVHAHQSYTPMQLTAKDVVGAAPDHYGGTGIGGWLNRRQKEQVEQQIRKNEKWNEVMMKRAKQQQG